MRGHHLRIGRHRDLRAITGANPDELNVGVAAALLAALPVLLILIFFQRHIVRGLTAGAVKG